MEKIARRRIAKTDLVVLLGDITIQDTDAIVNAANSGLLGGGGVDGAIHRAAGSTVDGECRAYVANHGPLPPGMAMWTNSGNLKARYVIHTVGPIYHSDEESEPVLRSAYQESLRLAKTLGLESISFPAISAGAYGYPLDKAAHVAIEAITEYLQQGGSSLLLVRLVCFSDASYSAFHRALKSAQSFDEGRGAKSEITVTVHLFSAPREFTGKSEIEVSLPTGARLSELIEHLSEEYPGLSKYLPYSKLAVNHAISTAELILNNGDTVALLPPVGGG